MSAVSIDELAAEIRRLNHALEAERHRVDYSLALHAGMEPVRQELLQLRGTAQFKAPYSLAEPLVTICVATYNRADLLMERCIASLRRQNYRNLQIVVVGDCCTDDTGARLARLRDDRIVFKNRARRGPYPKADTERWQVAGSLAMNDALDIAEGDFVCHLDDDDEALPDRISACVESAISNEAEFLWHRFYCELGDATWAVLGKHEQPVLGQVTTGSIFYHRFFKRVHWDVDAYRLSEPGDWNRVRRILYLRPVAHRIDNILTRHYKERARSEAHAKDSAEEFLP